MTLSTLVYATKVSLKLCASIFRNVKTAFLKMETAFISTPLDYTKGYSLLYPRRLESSIRFIKVISLFGQYVTEYKVRYNVQLYALLCL